MPLTVSGAFLEDGADGPRVEAYLSNGTLLTVTWDSVYSYTRYTLTADPETVYPGVEVTAAETGLSQAQLEPLEDLIYDACHDAEAAFDAAEERAWE